MVVKRIERKTERQTNRNIFRTKPRRCRLFWLQNEAKQCIWKKFGLQCEAMFFDLERCVPGMKYLYQYDVSIIGIQCIHHSLWSMMDTLYFTMYPSKQLKKICTTKQSNKKLYYQAKQSLCSLYDVLIDYDVKKICLGLCSTQKSRLPQKENSFDIVKTSPIFFTLPTSPQNC